MWGEAAMVMVSCVLFINMGLCEAIEKTLSVRFKILSCPKCLTMWSCLACLLLKGYEIIPSIAVSFIISYFAMWLTLVLDLLSTLYNKSYEFFFQPPGADKTSESPEADNSEAGGPDAVS